MAQSPSRATQLDVPSLRRRIRGLVISPSDAGYDDVRVVALGGIDRRPAVIVRVADTDDVREVIALARETGLELAVRAGGHSAGAFSAVDDGIVLDVRDLTSIDIDPEGRTVWAGAGLTARAVTEATSAHGLAIGFGDTGSVGIAGLTLGGGIGYLVRKHGLTIDSLFAVELVTADGEVRLVDESSDPDLFWALRGGGGNFGVATRFRYRLHPAAQLTGGMLLVPASGPIVASLMRVLDEAPDELSAIVNVMPCPPMPFVPAEQHGRLVAMVLACYIGPPDAAASVLAPLRAIAEPLADMLRPIAMADLYPPDDPTYRPTAVAKTFFLDTFDEAQAALAVERLGAMDAPMRAVQIRALGGAAARVSAEATAYAHRGRRFMANVAAFYAGPDDRSAKQAWVESLVRDLGPAPGAYVNFVGDEGPAGVHAAYPGTTWERLASLKRRYDPENLFHRVQNVPPAPMA